MTLRLRTFTSGNAGYSNVALGVTGVAVAFPAEAQGCVVSVSAPCWIGFRADATLITFNDANFGSIQAGNPYTFLRMRNATQTHVHVAPLSSTAIVTIAFI